MALSGIPASTNRRRIIGLTLFVASLSLMAAVGIVGNKRHLASVEERRRSASTTRKEESPPSNVGYNNATTTVASSAHFLADSSPKPNLTIIMHLSSYKSYGFSTYHTVTLMRFASGRFNYRRATEPGRCGGIKVYDGNASDDFRAPCLVVTPLADQLPGCHRVYPECKVMLIGDEWCRANGSGIDVRGGDDDSRRYPDVAYLPLGPRRDFWEAYRDVAAGRWNEKYIISYSGRGNVAKTPLASERKYVFNAIFTKSTSSSRSHLADLLEANNKSVSRYPTVLKIADKWTANLSQSESHMAPSEYVHVLLDSVFTLSPIGHNPECFRLYEAMEAGSIPVISVDRDYRRHRCKNSLRRMLKFAVPAVEAGKATSITTPIVILRSWDELFPRLDDLLRNRTELDERQAALGLWYRKFMESTVSRFEDIFLEEAVSASRI